MDEAELYVHVAQHHARELPDEMRSAADGVPDADGRVLAMLGSRVLVPTKPLAVAAHIPMKRPLTRGSRVAVVSCSGLASRRVGSRSTVSCWLQRRASNDWRTRVITSPCCGLNNLCSARPRSVPLDSAGSGREMAEQLSVETSNLVCDSYGLARGRRSRRQRSDTAA